jgi:hypothetical protein
LAAVRGCWSAVGLRLKLGRRSLLARLGVYHGNGGLGGVWRNGNTLVIGRLSLAAISGRMFRDTYCMGGKTSLAGGGVGDEGAVGDDGE